MQGLSEFIKKEAKVSFTLKQKAEELAEEEKADEAEVRRSPLFPPCSLHSRPPWGTHVSKSRLQNTFM